MSVTLRARIIRLLKTRTEGPTHGAIADVLEVGGPQAFAALSVLEEEGIVKRKNRYFYYLTPKAQKSRNMPTKVRVQKPKIALKSVKLKTPKPSDTVYGVMYKDGVVLYVENEKVAGVVAAHDSRAVAILTYKIVDVQPINKKSKRG